MRKLAREITVCIVDTYGAEAMLQRISDPFWFQALGCVLGFDWHSSGVTTTVCGALKEGIKGIEKDLGLFIAGGKGKTSRNTPREIEAVCDDLSLDGAPLIYASRLSAKVDSAAVQDGYQIYHHCFFFLLDGVWAVVQQGMNEETRYARRYHWLSKGVTDFVCEPHWAVCCDQREGGLNLVAQESDRTRISITELAHLKPEKILTEIEKARNLTLPRGHSVPGGEAHRKRLKKIVTTIYDRSPASFEEVLGIAGVGAQSLRAGIAGVGAQSLRALTLVSELIHGVSPSFKDPARYSFAHGGKDGHPYPVDRRAYDQTIDVLRSAVEKARIGDQEKMKAIRRLSFF
jgi:hypothetical protein